MAGCSATSGIGYLWQSAMGQAKLLGAAVPVDQAIEDPATPGRLRSQLRESQALRDFAVAQLALPDNDSYRRYADLGRPYVLWNVVAAPELSLKLQQWCFPVAGCVSYRGYFDEAVAQRFADSLAAQGMDTQVAGVPAYSTLGWFSDPLLSTFIQYPRVDLARMIFHELAHQRVYVQGDSTFNESYATACELIGVERWLDRQGTEAERTTFAESNRRRGDFNALLLRYRERLSAIYGSDVPDAQKRQQKQEALDAMRQEYRRMRDGAWQGFRGYDRWFERPLGNAHLGAVATYTRWVAAFRRLQRETGEDMAPFHAAVEAMAKLNPEQRLERLRTLDPGG